MKTSDIFETLLENLKVGEPATTVASRRDEITKALNKDFRDKDGCTDYKLMVGSFGRHTAIKGVSDLDMIFILPPGIRSSYDGDTGPRRILERVRDDLKARYKNTEVCRTSSRTRRHQLSRSTNAASSSWRNSAFSSRKAAAATPSPGEAAITGIRRSSTASAAVNAATSELTNTSSSSCPRSTACTTPSGRTHSWA